MHHKYLVLIMLIGSLLISCDKFEYNVYEVNRTLQDETVTTEYNINRLLHGQHKDSLHIIFTGDTQRFYDDVEDMVESVNELPDVDLVIITGDIADFGTAREYELINKQFKLLKVPFLTVIGNHDCLANGKELYEDIYGPLNYAFTWNGIRFIMHNTNSREYAFNGSIPDLDWMSKQLSDSNNYQSCIFVSHVPPYSDDFDTTLQSAYTSLIRNAKNTILSSNGHRHDYALEQPFNDGIWYLNTSSPSHRVYSYVTIAKHDRTGETFTCTPVAF